MFALRKPIIDSVKLILMCLQAGDSLIPDTRIMDGTSRQVEPVACFQGYLLSEFGHTKCNASLHNIDNFVVGM
jgi:hypothetical protein